MFPHILSEKKHILPKKVPFKQFLREYVDLIIVLQDYGKQREGSQRMEPFSLHLPCTPIQWHRPPRSSFPLMLGPGYLSVPNPLYTWLLYFISSFNGIILIRQGFKKMSTTLHNFLEVTQLAVQNTTCLQMHRYTHDHKSTQTHTYTSGLNACLPTLCFPGLWFAYALPSLTWNILEPGAG